MDNFIDKFAQRKNAQEMIRANAMAEAKEREKLAEQLSEHEVLLQEMRRCNLQNLENAEKVKGLLAEGLSKIEGAQSGKEGATAEELKALFGELADQILKRMDKQQAQTAELLERQQSWMEDLLGRQQDWMAGFWEGQQIRTAELLEAQKKQLLRMEELLEAQKSQMPEALEKQQARMEELFEKHGVQEMADALAEEQRARMEKLFEEHQKAAEDFGHKEAVKVYRNVQAVIDGALPKQTAEIAEAVKGAEKKECAPKGLVALGILTFLAAAGSVVIEVLRMLGYV